MHKKMKITALKTSNYLNLNQTSFKKIEIFFPQEFWESIKGRTKTDTEFIRESKVKLKTLKLNEKIFKF